MKLYRLQEVLLVAGIAAGLWLAIIQPWFLRYGDLMIKGGLFTLLFSIMITTSFKSLRKAMKNRRFFVAAMSTNFVIIPAVALVIGKAFAGHQPQILLGLVMYFVTPCTDWFLYFTHRARGDKALGLLLIPWNLLLQILLLPMYILLIIGEDVVLKVSDFFYAFLLFIILPFLLSRVVRFQLNKIRGAEVISSSFFQNLQTLSLAVVVLFMFALTGTEILDNTSVFPRVLTSVAAFLAIVFFLSKVVAGLASLSRAEYILLNFTASARNSPIALAIALGAFPDQPLAAAVIIIAPLVELPVLSIEAKLFRRKRHGRFP